MPDVSHGQWKLITKIIINNHRIRLTPRKTEILKLLCAGYDSLSISDKLNISIYTVNEYSSKLYKKCGVKNRTQLCLLMLNLAVFKLKDLI